MIKIAVLARLILSVISLAGIFLAAMSAQASNGFQETRIAYEIKKNIRQGEVIELTAGNQQFLAIYQEGDQPAKQGGLIILHGLGHNPDSPGVIRTLRTALTASGWDTLSIQMPIPSMEYTETDHASLVQEASPRITAAVNFLSEKKLANQAIIAQDFNAAMAAGFLEQAEKSTVDAFVMISLDGTRQPVIQSLSNIKQPVLDLYGSRDRMPVVQSSSDRKRAIVQKAENPSFRQMALEGADHLYTGMGQSVLSLVRGWLKKNAAGASQNLDDPNMETIKR